MSSDLLERMRNNPAIDWRIQDVEALCREYGCCFAPAGHIALSRQASCCTRNSDHPRTPTDKACLNPQARALY